MCIECVSDSNTSNAGIANGLWPFITYIVSDKGWPMMAPNKEMLKTGHRKRLCRAHPGAREKRSDAADAAAGWGSPDRRVPANATLGYILTCSFHMKVI